MLNRACELGVAKSFASQSIAGILKGYTFKNSKIEVKKRKGHAAPLQMFQGWRREMAVVM